MTAEERLEKKMRLQKEKADQIPPGEYWIHRAQDKGPSRKVLIIGPRATKTNVQMEVEHLEGARAGQKQWVGLERLKGPWVGVEEYDALQDRWRRLEDSDRDVDWSELTAALAVFQQLIPATVAAVANFPFQYAVQIHDISALELICQDSLEEVLGAEDSIEDDGARWVGAAATIRIARAACAARFGEMLPVLAQRERRLLLQTASRNTTGLETEASATAVLHEWCGTREATVGMHFRAAERERERLNGLVRAAVTALRSAGRHKAADRLEEQLRQGVIHTYADPDDPDYREDGYPDNPRFAGSGPDDADDPNDASWGALVAGPWGGDVPF